MNTSLCVILEEAPNPDDVTFVQEQLSKFNASQVGPDNHRTLFLFLRDQDGTVHGGLPGGTYWGCLPIDVLWVDDAHRHSGYGHSLLRAAEFEEIRRRCCFVHLDTHDFQALEFYLKEGYAVAGKIDELPAGHTRYLLRRGFVDKEDLHGARNDQRTP